MRVSLKGFVLIYITHNTSPIFPPLLVVSSYTPKKLLLVCWFQLGIYGKPVMCPFGFKHVKHISQSQNHKECQKWIFAFLGVALLDVLVISYINTPAAIGNPWPRTLRGLAVSSPPFIFAWSAAILALEASDCRSGKASKPWGTRIALCKSRWPLLFKRIFA